MVRLKGEFRCAGHPHIAAVYLAALYLADILLLYFPEAQCIPHYPAPLIDKPRPPVNIGPVKRPVGWIDPTAMVPRL